MLNNEILNQKITEVFGASKLAQEIIQQTDKAALILVETNEDYALITVKDFTELPIGGHDLFVEARIQKSGDTLKDMGELIKFFQQNINEIVNQFQNKIFEYTETLNETAKNIGINSIAKL
ncbi:hypothetical protein EKG37_21105 [Robertmurraya yapensis]|uniref:Uncharacterized protein n=1 Tax=Bacillus yapensis TaxID=2492960 RepID=A0A3S0KGZ3_9BACI|nr:hypothetical protein [Bacillus yapensis]RTR26572.1 hypothetical protein EKG37_21105 [Bacillus yapensis]TKS93747.1 hypothetical protein FAR12_21110 [Bacillus yapensis]